MIELILNADKIMYGNSFLNIKIDNNTCFVSWASIADGGVLCDEGQKEYKDIDIQGLLSKLKAVDLPNCFDDKATYSWGFSIIDSENNDLSVTLELGEWDSAIFDSILQIIGKYFMDNDMFAIIEDFNEF